MACESNCESAFVLEAEIPAMTSTRGDQAFLTLLRHIQRIHVSATVPVKAELKPGMV